MDGQTAPNHVQRPSAGRRGYAGFGPQGRSANPAFACVHGATRGMIRVTQFVATKRLRILVLSIPCGIRASAGWVPEDARGGMRDTYLCSPSNGGCGRATSSYRRAGAIARRSAILLSGTAAIALTVAQPASAIVINDPVAAAVGGIENYYDRGNQFP